MQKLSSTIIICVLALSMSVFAQTAKKTTATTSKTPTKSMNTTLPDGLYAKFNVTKGTIICKLEPAKAPVTVCNFVALVEGKMDNKAKAAGQHFYDGLKFHRVIANFMIQGGDPAGNGSGGPGYSFEDEFDPSLRFDGPGILAMANSGPGTNGSQFFITHVPTPWLNDHHTIFGHVVEGQKVVDSTAQGDEIKSVEIIRVGKEAKEYMASTEKFNQLRAEIGKRMEEKKAAAKKEFVDFVMKAYPNAKTTPSGLMYVVTQEGNGPLPEVGKEVTVHYTGTLLDGKKFDSSLDRNEPFKFPLGQGRVIKGWDEGIALLKEGSKAKLFIPYQLAYGERGYPGAIPPSANLIFDVELLPSH